MVLLGLVGAVLAAVFVLGGGESPSVAVNRFMIALARGDVETLTRMSHMPGESEESVRRQWDRAVNVVGPYYRFRWQVLTQTVPDERTANVQLWVWRNAASPGAFEEKFGIPLVRVDGDWRIDVRGINRGMFPGMPR
jgi:hypothetical protein